MMGSGFFFLQFWSFFEDFFVIFFYMLKLSHFSAIEGNLVPLSLMELNP